MAGGGAKSPGVRARGRGRAHRVYACAHAAGRAGLRGEGAAAAEAASLFPRPGRCVSARVATGEVGRDGPCGAIEPPSLWCPRAAASRARGGPGDARSPCGPGPPAAPQVFAVGSRCPPPAEAPACPVSARRRRGAGLPARPRGGSPVLANAPCGAKPGRAEPGGAGAGQGPASGAPPARSPPARLAGVLLAPEGSAPRAPGRRGTARPGAVAARGPGPREGPAQWLGHLWPVLKVGTPGVGWVWAGVGWLVSFLVR